MITRQVVVEGHVQGVGFRNYTRRSAIAHNVDGWVKNDDEGTVTMVLQGEEENVNAVVNSVRDGPQLSTVKAVEEASIDNPSSYDDFMIRR